MNNENIEDVNLDDVDLTGAGDGITNASAPAGNEAKAADEVTQDKGADVINPAPAAVAATPVRKGAGRHVDTEGKTALGKARNIYAANASLSVKELKQKFEADLGVSPQVAQTYASLVRRKNKAVA
jgi:hypothetical protein